MNLRNSFITGIKWSFVQQGLTQVLNYISIFWLANLITPEDFGRVALVVVLVGAFEAINGFGVSQLIIRDHIVDRRIISTYFWLIVGLSTALFLACLVGGIVYSLFFDFTDLIVFYSLIVVSSLSIPINGVNSVFSALYSRDLDFKFPARIFVFSLLVGNSLAIVSGYLGWGFWALLIKNLIPNVIISLCYWIHGRYKMFFYFDRLLIKGTWNFSSNFTYFNALNYLIRNLDYVLIGRFFDLATVGQYSIAYKIMLFPMKNITARIHTILYPVLVKMKNDIKRIERTSSIIVSGIAYLIFPLIVLVSSLAHLWIPIIFDVERYDKLVVLVQVLSVVGAVRELRDQ
ncbi:MAG: oligosaccharide flippase family protein [Cytophagales bacterium]|nr:oligosaccharide flippase family protein [Cytophagales bacterium]